VIVRAPGKLVLTGAYAVLEGAPALVVAVDRYARADASRTADAPSAEVVEAIGSNAPFCDAEAMYEGGKKLGLGSSAAVLVASLGARAAKSGQDLADPDVRSRLFARARDAHMIVQGGGSGVDVAASTYGGVLRYALHAGRPWVLASSFPEDLTLAAFFSGTSARTSDLLGRVAELRAKDPEMHRNKLAALISASQVAAEIFEAGSGAEFVAAARAYAGALDELGDAADANIVPLDFRRLDVVAGEEDAVFFPSGAGGGDVGVYLGPRPPTENFTKRAALLGMQPIPLQIDREGVRSEVDAAGITP